MEAQKKQRRLEQEKKRKGKKRRKRASFDREDDEPGFHFIAYVPAGGRIWRMDGMEAFPRCIGMRNSWVPCFKLNLLQIP